MRLTLLAIAGTILSAAADNPLRLLSHESKDINDPVLSCIQNIDYTPPCDTKRAACWCQDKKYLTHIDHCIRDPNSGSVESTLLRVQKWCNLETPIQPTLIPSKDYEAHSSLKSAINQFSKRYVDSNRHSGGVPWQAILGICAAVAGAAFIISCCFKGIKRDRENNPYRSGKRLPVYEPNRGRSRPRAYPRPSCPRAEHTPRAPTPPPPYVREPERVHVKSNSEEPGLPSYDDQLRGSNAA